MEIQHGTISDTKSCLYAVIQIAHVYGIMKEGEKNEEKWFVCSFDFICNE